MQGEAEVQDIQIDQLVEINEWLQGHATLWMFMHLEHRFNGLFLVCTHIAAVGFSNVFLLCVVVRTVTSWLELPARLKVLMHMCMCGFPLLKTCTKVRLTGHSKLATVCGFCLCRTGNVLATCPGSRLSLTQWQLGSNKRFTLTLISS